MGYYLLRTLLCIGLLAPLCSALPAQDSGKTAAVVIEVKDESGAIVQNARIEIVPSQKNIGVVLTVDADGRLRTELALGIYDLKVQAPGFGSLKKRLEVQAASPQLVSVVVNPISCSGGCPLYMEHIPELPVLLSNPSLATSPDRRYVVVEDANTWPDHTFFLEDHDLTIQRKLFTASQDVLILWSSDSKSLAVTDYPGGNIYRCFIYSVKEDLPPIRLLDLIARNLSETEREGLDDRLSRRTTTIQALKWVKETELELTLSGFDVKIKKNFIETYLLTVDFHAGSTAPIWLK